ncbi:MAG: FAD-dependent oxidoreductase [Gordonibacter sp.]|uniref:FAD-dependent oxidoreductase n=1 Tax=Gordonibacter sp. TaxID=1968902 RepID=UPI002FCB992C
MERRAFFKLIGISAAVAAGGTAYACSSGHGMLSLVPAAEDSSAYRIANDPQVSFSSEVDVLIVGSGIAGLSAAMAPAEAGHSVMVVDKLDLLGGESFSSNGIMRVSGSAFQKAAGIDTTAIEAWDARKQELADEGVPDIEFAKRLFVTAPDWIDHLVDTYQVELADPRAYVKGGGLSTVLLPKNGLGDMESFMVPLRNGLANKGVAFSTGLQAVAFIQDGGGAICGMRLLAVKNQAVSDIRAKRVVVATGGFASSQPLIHAYVPNQEQVASYTFASMGEGQMLCSGVGGKLAGMDKAGPLTGRVPQSCAWGMFAPAVIVDLAGKRFAREDDVNAAADACHADDRGHWWTIFDKQLIESSQSRSVAQVTAKYVKRLVGPCDTLDDLAKAMFMPAEALKAAFEEYDKTVESGKDEAFGRTLFLQKLIAPYYAFRQSPVRYKTRGGANTDGEGRLLNATGSPVSGVYCCGSVGASSLEGLASNGAFGMLVGQAVAKVLAEEEGSDVSSASA